MLASKDRDDSADWQFDKSGLQGIIAECLYSGAIEFAEFSYCAPPARKALGVMPINRRKRRLKVARSLNPASNATVETGSTPARSHRAARWSRVRRTY